MLLPYQREFIQSDEQIVVLMAERGGGKTFAMCEAIREHLRTSRACPEVILFGYEFSWWDLIDKIADDERQADPHESGAKFSWDVPILDFIPIDRVDITSLWGRGPTFVGADNLEMLTCGESEFFRVLASLMRNDGIFRATVDPNSKMPNWMVDFIQGDGVKVINGIMDNLAGT